MGYTLEKFTSEEEYGEQNKEYFLISRKDLIEALE